GVQERISLHHRGLAQRPQRPVHRPCRGRPAVGVLCRRPARPDGSSGVDKFSVMGFCIGGPFIWSLLKRAPTRIAAAVLAQPVGWRPEMRDPKYPGTFWKGWPSQLTAKRPEIPMQTADQFATRMFETNADF